MRFIAAMDHSGGSTGGVLDRYEQYYTEEDKMDKVHAMRLRMVNSPNFTSENIWAAILYKDTVERGMVTVLHDKNIAAILKIDSGCTEQGTLKDFNLNNMLNFAVENHCYGTKMRSIVKERDVLDEILDQQMELAGKIYAWELMPIVEPEIPIDHKHKQGLEIALFQGLKQRLDVFEGKCILKLTLPQQPNMYRELINHPNVHKVVGLSGGYTTKEACEKLSQNTDMTASFSRALSEGLKYSLTEEEFNATINNNIRLIEEASN